MKVYNYLRRLLLLALLGAVAGTACSQQPKSPKVATSANAQTVYKPQDAKKETADADKMKPVKESADKKVPAKKKAADKKTPAVKKNDKNPAAAKKNGQEAPARAGKADKKPAPKQKAAPAAKKQAQGQKPAAASKAKQGKKASAANSKKQNTAPAAAKKQKEAPRKAKDGRYIALKTNVPFQVLSVHNLALEVQVQKHVTIDFPVMWSISDLEREHAVRGMALQPEGRWWLKQAGKGHFFGVHAHAAWFNLKWEENRYQTGHRPLLGAGISYGYKLPLSAHWGAEFNIGAGYANMEYNTYYNIENGAMLNKRIRHYWGITRAGISLVYRF